VLRVRFFASVREALDTDELQLEWPAGGCDLDSLQDELCARGGAVWRDVLQRDNMIRAVNHSVVTGNPALSDGDEVAFFPPVTGG